MTDTVFSKLDALISPAHTVDGIRWYSAVAVCSALQILDGKSAVQQLDTSDRTNADFSAMLISEPAFFRLALSARAPEAVRLREWLCLTVLPAIWVSNSYVMTEELAIKAKVGGVLDLAEWKIEHASRYLLPLLRKNNFYFSGMENVALGLAAAEDFEQTRDEAIDRKIAELRALGFSI